MIGESGVVVNMDGAVISGKFSVLGMVFRKIGKGFVMGMLHVRGG